jgi:hypothetical protein
MPIATEWTSARLLRAAMAEVAPAGTRPPQYIRDVPPDWREGELTRRVVEDRMGALGRGGARMFVERLRFEWRPGTPGHRADGTLDAHSRDDLTPMSARAAAVKHYEDELARYRSPREWWRIATLPDGEPVGFVTPAANARSA